MIQIPPQAGSSFELGKGHILAIRSPTGQQVCDLFCFSKARPRDALSSGRSIDYNETVRFTKGHVLYSNAGYPLLEIFDDTCGVHDFLVTPCSSQMFQMISGSNQYHPSCQENLCKGFLRYDLPEELITTTFNIFMNYRIDEFGDLSLLTPTNTSEDYILLKAREDLIVGLTACADEATNGGECKPIEYSITNEPNF
jgi:uncharacterized protein